MDRQGGNHHGAAGQRPGARRLAEGQPDPEGAEHGLEQEQEADLGGTMRLGAYDCSLSAGSRSAAAYGQEQISERHRHRFEFNDAFRSQLEDTGLVIAGIHDQSGLVEVVERAESM